MDYRLDELSLTLPDGAWEDRSAHDLIVRAPDGSALRLVVDRDDPVAPEGLAARIDADLGRESRRLPGFELLGRWPLEHRDATAIGLRFRVTTPKGVVHNEVAYLALPSALLVFTVTAPAAHGGACVEVVQQLIATMALR